MTTVLSFQGFGLILNLLTSTNKEVLVSTCAVIAKLAKYKNILTTLTEYGIVSLLTKLTNTVRTPSLYSFSSHSRNFV